MPTLLDSIKEWQTLCEEKMHDYTLDTAARRHWARGFEAAKDIASIEGAKTFYIPTGGEDALRKEVVRLNEIIEAQQAELRELRPLRQEKKAWWKWNRKD